MSKLGLSVSLSHELLDPEWIVCNLVVGVGGWVLMKADDAYLNKFLITKQDFSKF